MGYLRIRFEIDRSLSFDEQISSLKHYHERLSSLQNPHGNTNTKLTILARHHILCQGLLSAKTELLIP